MVSLLRCDNGIVAVQGNTSSWSMDALVFGDKISCFHLLSNDSEQKREQEQEGSVMKC